MSATVRALVTTDQSIGDASLQTVLGAEPGLEVLGFMHIDTARRERPLAPDANALVVVCGHGGQENAVALIEEAVSDRPDRPVVVLSCASPNGFVREALQAGADDLVVLNGSGRSGTEVYFALEKALTRREWASAGTVQQSQLVCVLGPKGGTGKTLTSTNLAVALAEQGHRTLIIDVDLQFGDVGLGLGLQPEKTLFDLATSGGSLDSEKVTAFTVAHPSGLDALLAPIRPDQAAAVRPEFLRELYAVVSQTYDRIVVDTPPGFTPEVITTIDSASDICLLATLDAPSLKNAKLGLETLQLMGYPQEKVKLVLNRADSNVGISHPDVLNLMGRAPDVLIPSHRDIVRSVNAGTPVVDDKPRSDGARAFRALAEMLAPEPEPHAADGDGRRRLRLARKG